MCLYNHEKMKSFLCWLQVYQPIHGDLSKGSPSPCSVPKKESLDYL